MRDPKNDREMFCVTCNASVVHEADFDATKHTEVAPSASAAVESTAVPAHSAQQNKDNNSVDLLRQTRRALENKLRQLTTRVDACTVDDGDLSRLNALCAAAASCASAVSAVNKSL
jgi:hypothetical protein